MPKLNMFEAGDLLWVKIPADDDEQLDVSVDKKEIEDLCEDGDLVLDVVVRSVHKAVITRPILRKIR